MHLPTRSLWKQPVCVIQFPSQQSVFERRNGMLSHSVSNLKSENRDQKRTFRWLNPFSDQTWKRWKSVTKNTVTSSSSQSTSPLVDTPRDDKQRFFSNDETMKCPQEPSRQTPCEFIHLTSWNSFSFSLIFCSREYLALSAFCRWQLKSSVSFFSFCSSAVH